MLNVKTCPKCGGEMYPQKMVEEEYDTNSDGDICYDGEGFPLTTGRVRDAVLQWDCSYCDYGVAGDSDDPDDVGEWHEK